MSPEMTIAAAAAMSAVAALAALAVAAMSLRESRESVKMHRRHAARALDDTLQSRLDPMYPGLRNILGYLEDGVPKEIRLVLIPFFVLFSDAFGAHRDGLFDERDWVGFSLELTYWAQKPTARKAWQAFRQQTWTEGFAEYVDSILQGPPAYANLTELESESLSSSWSFQSP